jgi:hypothetical protein
MSTTLFGALKLFFVLIDGTLSLELKRGLRQKI